MAAAVLLECHLHSRSEGTTEVKFLSLASLPSTVLDLKQLVQAEFSVPACAQTVAFQTEVLADEVELASRSLRGGDTVDVSFLSGGDCRSLDEVNAWIRHLLRTFDENCLRGEQGDYQVEVVVYDGIQGGLDSALGYDLFEWLIPRTMVNKAYFETSGGLQLLLKLYRRILSRSWSGLRVYQKYLENVCTQAFANYGETAGLRRKLVGMGLLDLCFRSLLRVPIPLNQPVSDLTSKPADQEINDSLLKGELDNALHLLCCIAELPECQLAIASRSDVVAQTVSMALSPSYPCQTKALASEVFLCLAHTSSTHQFLATEPVISGMLQALADEASNSETTPSALTGLRCFTLVWMAIILLQSPLAFPQRHLPQVQACLSQFLSETTINDIRSYETERGTIWATLLPYVKLFFLPGTLSMRGGCESPVLPLSIGFRDLCLRVILLFLHSKVATPMYHALLEKEELLDFVVCLPWYVSSSCRSAALALVCDLRTSLPRVGPPQLLGLAKARLASDRLGLEAVLELSVGTIAACFYSSEHS